MEWTIFLTVVGSVFLIMFTLSTMRRQSRRTMLAAKDFYGRVENSGTTEWEKQYAAARHCRAIANILDGAPETDTEYQDWDN